MRFLYFELILFGLSLCQASPVAEVVKIRKRDLSDHQEYNPCDGINALPILYHKYGEADCPAKLKLTADGNYAPGQHFDQPFLNRNCKAFCQIRTNFVYGTENPFPNSYCHGPFSCTTTTTVQTNVAWGGTVTSEWLKPFGLGSYYAGWEIHSHCGDDYKTISNFCGSDKRLNSDGSPDGDTIFVYTDCVTRMPLDMGSQDPVYQKPGVPLDRGTLGSIFSKLNTAADPGVTCDVSYRLVLDYFEIRGKGWTSDEEGSNGDNLKAAVSKCGALTTWSFQYTPNDPTYQWYAHGNLPIGTKTCVGKAVESAGGDRATSGNCHGAG